MGTITIKNLSARADWVAITAVAFLMSEGRGALRKEFGEDINITQRGNTYTVTDAEEVTE